MRYSAYLPIGLLEAVSPHLDYDFLEPIEDVRYVDFYKKSDRYKFVDNGLIELGESLGHSQLSYYFRRVEGTCIASPDRLGDWRFNKIGALGLAQRLPREVIWVTLAGPTPLRFFLQALWVRAHRFGGICLPYRRNRVALPLFHHQTHLFGYRKPEFYKNWWEGTTLDTVEPINSAVYGIEYFAQGIVSYPRTKNYAERNWLSYEIDRAISNVQYFKQMLNK